jgi:two-component system sensor histidine kinase CreC
VQLPTTDAQVLGDAPLLQQALQHLIDNAMDFSPQHGYVRWEIQPHAEHIVLTLANQGPPIPDYALARVTEKFYSLPRPDNQGQTRKSTGLGLSFVEQVMQLHQGKLQIANLPDGVVIGLEFPR